ncbi:MAG: hypothetical protein IKT02_00480, partial [Bacteroidales bacterium]|nr:hypothetical protein [Bacteroidales bacterium]
MKKILLSLFLVACYFVGMSQCNSPRDLQGTTTKNKVVLSWTAPAQQSDEEILTWSGTELSSGIGLGSLTEFNCLHKFLASELSNYVGWQVTKIAFTPYQSGTFTVKVWKGTGANPSGNPMLTQSVPNPSLQSMNVIVLTSPFTIEANQTYWFGYGAAAPSSAEYPAGTDAGPAVSGKGDIVGFGSSWTTLTANDLDYNFIIQTTVVNAKGEEKVLAIDKGGTVASYNVYRNGSKIGNTVAETYTDTGLEMETTYNYCVEAVWTDGCVSEQVCGDFTTQGLTCTPPETVTVSTTLDAMNISWTAPYIPSSEEWLTWAGEPDFGNGIGTGSATTFSVAHRFQVAEIAPYAGYELTKVRFSPCESACTYTVRVWVGGTSGTNPGTMVVNQLVPAEEITLNAWNEITLDNPVSITGAEEVWFGYYVNTTTGYPAGVDSGPAVTGKGDLMHFGGSWTTLYDLGLDYNWSIQGFVQNDGKGVYLNSPVTSNDETKGNIEDLRAAHTRIFRAAPVKGYRDAVASYNIYVDGDLMGSVNGNTFEYSIDGFEDGKYDVCVTALYDNGCESLPTCANTEIVTSCWPANNLEATILAKKNVKLTWSEPIDPFAPTTWISWSSSQAGSNSIGTGSASDFCCAHRFEPEDIAEYDGMNIVAINFVPGVAGDQCDYYIRVWVGGNETGPDELVYDQAVDGSTIVTKAWNLVYLDTPVTIDAREELWIGYRCNTTTGHPGGCDDGPRVDYKGNMMYFGGEWMTMWDAGGGSQANLDYNWSIQGGLADAQGKIHFMSPIADNMNASPVNVTFSAAPMQESGVKMPAFDHYLVYRDGEMIENTQSKTFTDTNRPNGTYLYEVTAVYVNGCESDPISVEVYVEGDDIITITATAEPAEGGMADITLLKDCFEEYTVGGKIATEAIAAGHEWWTTWTNAPGSAEDGIVADFDGNQCAHFIYGNDQVLLLGNQTGGTFTCSFDMYIPNGKDAYNNVLHAFAGSGSEWATEVYFKHSSNGTTIKAGGVNYNFDCPYNAWFNVKYDIDLDNDQATFFIDDVAVCTWQFSLQANGSTGTRQLAAMDFYPPTSTAVSEYYVDNVIFKKVGNGTFSHGETCTLTATANTGYTFTNWTENGTVVSTSKTYSFVVTGDRNLVANFAQFEGNYLSIGNYNGVYNQTITAGVNLDNGDEVAGLQVDIPLGDNFTYVEGTIALTDRATANHVIYAGMINHVLRVIVYSLPSTPFIGTTGEIFTFGLTLGTEAGIFPLPVENAILSDLNGISLPVEVSNGSVTVVEPEMFEITATAAPAEGGTVTGAGTYLEGTTATLTATAI